MQAIWTKTQNLRTFWLGGLLLLPHAINNLSVTQGAQNQFPPSEFSSKTITTHPNQCSIQRIQIQHGRSSSLSWWLRYQRYIIQIYSSSLCIVQKGFKFHLIWVKWNLEDRNATRILVIFNFVELYSLRIEIRSHTSYFDWTPSQEHPLKPYRGNQNFSNI